MVKVNRKPKRGPGKIRGLAPEQYLILFRMVKRGEATWEELERKGVALPPARKSSEYRKHVRKVLDKA